MKLLILSPDYSTRTNWGHQHLRDALLDLVNPSVQYGEGRMHKGKTHIPDICNEVSKHIGYPDAVLMENWKNMIKYTGGDEVDCLKAFIVCDYFPDVRNHFVCYNEVLNRLDIDLAICNTPDVLTYIRDQKRIGNLSSKLDSLFISQGVDTRIFRPRELEKIYDVMAVYGLVSYVYPTRPAVQELISNMPGVKPLVGDWKGNIKHYDYARAINQSKIFVCANGVNDQVLMKYFEVMASGTFLLTNVPRSCGRFGLIPGVHFGVWENFEDLKEKIYYYLKDDSARDNIAKAGMALVRRKFSTYEIAMQVSHAISIELNKKKESIPDETGII